MMLVVWFLVCVLLSVGAQDSTQPPVFNATEAITSAAPTTERSSRFLNFKHLYSSAVETNEIESEEKKEDDPDDALDGWYSECVLSFSLPCLQKKFLVFLDKLGRMDGFNIFGNLLSVKRTTKETTKPITQKVLEARMNYPNNQEDLSSLVEYTVDRFFKSHTLQLRLPFGLQVTDVAETGRSSDEGSAIELAFPRGLTEGRGKKKKIFLLLMMLAKAKLSLLLPLAIIFIKFKAVKALFFAKLALALSLFGLAKAIGLGGLAAGGAGLAAGTAGLSSLAAGSKGALAGGLGGLGGLAGGLGGGGGGGGGHYGGGGGGYGGGGGGYGGGGGSNKVVIIHDPHHVTGGHHDGGGGGGGGGGYGGYGTSGGGGGWSSGGGGDSYSSGGSGGWGRSWTPTDAHAHLLPYRKLNSTNKT